MGTHVNDVSDSPSADPAADPPIEAEGATAPSSDGNRAALLNLGALIAGGALGWFLGPHAAALLPVSKAMLNLLNMLSVPFIVVGLIHGVGQLPSTKLAALARGGGKALLAVLGIGIATCWAAACLFPVMGNASFYSPSLESAGAESQGLLSVLIPDNPFRALAEGGIPAIVFFCLLFAWSLAHVEDRQPLLNLLDIAFRVLEGMWSHIERLLPLITLCLSTTAVGLVDPSMFGRLRVYFVAVIAMSLFLALLVFPLLIGRVTGIGFRDALKRCYGPMQMSFLTGSVMAVLPLISLAVEEMLRHAPDAPPDDNDRSDEIATTVLIGYQFPLVGSMLVLVYMLFAASTFDRPLDVLAQVKLATLGMLALFGSSASAAGFMCDMLGLPYDAVAVYTSVDSLTDRFECALEVVSLLAVTVFTYYGVHQPRRVSYGRLGAIFAVLLLPFTGMCLLASGWLMSPPSIRDYYQAHRLVLSKDVSIKQRGAPSADASPPSGLSRIRKGEPLRVGVERGQHPPFFYLNGSKERVGYSLELAGLLASSLRGRVDLVEVDATDWVSPLQSGGIDIMLTPVLMTSERISRVAFPATFGNMTPVLVVRDARRTDIMRRRDANDFSGLRVAIAPNPFARGQLARVLPGAELVPVDSPDALLKEGTADALLWLDLEAAAWEVTNPDFGHVTLAVQPLPAGYPVRLDDIELQSFVGQWLEVLESRGDLKRLHDDWFLGKSASSEPKAPVDRLLELLNASTGAGTPR